MSARYRKLWRDLSAERGRVSLMVAAIAVSLWALGSVLGAWSILTREIRVSYLGTRPAHATLEISGGVTPEIERLAARHPLVSEVDAREVLISRVHVGSDWRPLLLFVAPDFGRLRLNVFRHEAGAFPPPPGTILLERSATGMAEAQLGDSIEIKTSHGPARRVLVSGLVHDPGLAPAWQERSVYGYATRETLELLDGQSEIAELRVRFRQEPEDASAADRAAQELGQWLGARGVEVSELRVPPPRQHPHQRQMTTVLVLLVSFAALSLVLASVLVATSLAAFLARQVREIGVMKTLGARSGQIFGLYALLVGSIALAAVALSLPLGVLGARAGARAISTMLNFDLQSSGIPAWVLAIQVGSGILLPLGLALLPIRRAAFTSIRTSLDAYGVGTAGGVSPRFPRSVRNLLRRPRRLALTLALLGAGGALFMTALSLSAAWERNLDKIHETRHYDVEVRLHAAPPAALLLQRVAGVRSIEWWGYAPAAFAAEGRIDVVRTYPDRGHGSLTLLGPPPRTPLISFPLLAGRWLRDGDDDEVVLNHSAAAQAGGARPGAALLLSAEGRVRPVRVVGVVEEIGAAGVVYMNRDAFSAEFAAPRMARAKTESSSVTEREAAIRRIEQALGHAGASVEAVLPFAELRTAVGDHVLILVRALVALASVLALVGLLGLTSTFSTSVLERTRELAVMKAIGASSRRILTLLLSEGLLTALASAVLAFLLTLPLTYAVESAIGRLGFLAPLPFVLAPSAVLVWIALVSVFGLLSIWFPARRAASTSVREALGSV